MHIAFCKVTLIYNKLVSYTQSYTTTCYVVSCILHVVVVLLTCTMYMYKIRIIYT